MKNKYKKTSILTKAMALAFLCTGLNQTLNAQCSTNFTYSTTASSISATNTSTGTSSPYVYWSLANVGGSAFTGSYDAAPVFTSLYNGNYVLTLSVDSTGGSCSPLSQTITISGGANAPACTASFSYSVGAAGAVTFTNTSPADAMNNTNYYWSFGDGNSSYALSPSYTYYYNGTYTITLNTSNYVTGCSTSSTETLTITNANTTPPCTSNFTYTVNTAGEVDFTSLYTGSVTLDSSSIDWTFGDGQYAYDSLTPSHTYAYNGTYSVTLYINDHLANCYSNTTQTISITNTANQPCIASVTFSMHQDSINPQPGIWQVSAYYSPQVTEAIWYWGDGSSDNGLSPTHTYTAAGLYNICVMAIASCGDSSYVCQNDSLYRNSSTNSMISVTVQNVNGNTSSGIKTNMNNNIDISVYPNPASTVLQVSGTKSQDIISIYNVIGNEVLQTKENSIDISNLQSGVYFVRVNNSIQKFIKQ